MFNDGVGNVLGARRNFVPRMPWSAMPNDSRSAPDPNEDRRDLQRRHLERCDGKWRVFVARRCALLAIQRWDLHEPLKEDQMNRRAAIVALFSLFAVSAGALERRATCTGANPCNACKNCKYCKRCAKDGKTCGTCRRAMALSHGGR
jgi:hypothetical protein